MELKIIAIFSEFDLFPKLSQKCGMFSQKCGNSGRKAKCGISHTVAGWLTPMQIYHQLAVFISFDQALQPRKLYFPVSFLPRRDRGRSSTDWLDGDGSV